GDDGKSCCHVREGEEMTRRNRGMLGRSVFQGVYRMFFATRFPSAIAVALAAAACYVAPAQAQEGSGSGEVRRVDPKAGKVTIQPCWSGCSPATRSSSLPVARTGSTW